MWHKLGQGGIFLRRKLPIFYSALLLTGVNLLLRLVSTSFQVFLSGRIGAAGIGLMQLTPAEFAMIQTDILRVPPEDKGFLYDPQKNLQCGTAYLSYLYQRYGVWETVFAAFDAGTASVDAWLANPEYVTELGTLKNIPDKQTARFVRDVMKARELYIKLYF